MSELKPIKSIFSARIFSCFQTRHRAFVAVQLPFGFNDQPVALRLAAA
jgi:hypothetical protein